MRALLLLGVLAMPAASQPTVFETCPIPVFANLHAANQALAQGTAEAAILSDRLNKLILAGEQVSAESKSPLAAVWAQDADKVRELADSARRSLLAAQVSTRRAHVACPSPSAASVVKP